MNSLSLKAFLDSYGENIAEKITKDLTVIHNPQIHKEQTLTNLINDMKKKPFPSQAEIIKACYKSTITNNKTVYIVAECGTGKTLQSIGLAYLLFKLKNIRRVLVICPPHLVPKWIQEIKDSLWNVKAYNFNGKDIIRLLENLRKQPKPSMLEFYIIGRERAKAGFIWRPAVISKHNKYFCPKCGQELLDKDGYPLPVFERTNQGGFKKKHACKNTIEKWKYNKEENRHEICFSVCNEQLWQPDISRKNFRKAIPAKFIKTKMKGFFDLLITDEVHQFKNESGQGYAFGVLASSCKYTVCLTGTLAGGYASDVYYLLFRTHAKQMLSDSNNWSNPKQFIEKYGILERITTVQEQDGLTTKAKRKTIIKEKPGISPLLLGKMLLPNSVFLRLSDCMDHLQPYEENVFEIAMNPDMYSLYKEFESIMKKALLEALVKGDHSLLGGYLHALLSYPERIYRGISVIHPHTKDIIAIGPPLQGIMPKEQELVSIIKQEISQNRKVLLFIQNSNTTDISPRLFELLEKENLRIKVLKSGDTESRASIIDKWVEQGLDVLITNPKKVEVGMDLLDFPSIIFYQIPMSTYTLRQASRRSWRIPQKRPVKVFFLTYSDTMQTRLMKLMADKLMCSLALEGELTDKGLAALSDTSDSMAQELAKMLIEKSEDNKTLKDIWSDYRKKEVLMEVNINRDIESDKISPEIIEKSESKNPAPDIKKASVEIEKFGDKVVKVEFVEFIGKKKKKITHIEVKESDLDEMLSSTENPIHVQYSMF